MATERIVTRISHDRRLTLRSKIEQYDRYLTSGRFAKTYAAYGEFRHFTLLFVTYGEASTTSALPSPTCLQSSTLPCRRGVGMYGSWSRCPGAGC
jgi:hypothetical protein